MSDSGKRLKQEEDLKNKFKNLRNKKGTGLPVSAALFEANRLGMAGNAVRDLLDELAKETAASKKNVMGMDKITGSFPGAGRAATKRLTVDEMKKMSPGEKKARFGKAFKVGGVVDLSTEQEV